MNYQLTQHAKDVLLERRIPIEYVERILNAPERFETDANDSALEHRLGRIAEYGNRVLRVVVNPHDNPATVITAFFDRKMRGKL